MSQTDSRAGPVEDHASARSSSRRKSSRSAAKVSPLRNPNAGRVILGAMAALTLVYVVFTLYTVRHAAMFYGDITIGGTRRETRYAMGTPATIAPPAGPATSTQDDAALERAPRWYYRAGTATTALDFGENGRLRSVTCGDVRLDSFGCPPALGVTLGMFEDEIWYRLGAPDHESYQGDTKNIGYDGLGLTFALRKFEVVAIKLADARANGGGAFPYLSRVPRLLRP